MLSRRRGRGCDERQSLQRMGFMAESQNRDLSAPERLWVVIGGWWSAMSGALSIPVYFLGISLDWSPQRAMGIAAIVALLALSFSIARQSWEMLTPRFTAE